MLNRLILLAFISISALCISACDSSNEPRKPTASSAKLAAAEPQSQVSPVVYWAKPGFAPLFILKGPFKERGMGDEIFSLLQQRIPGFKHINTEANYPRIITEMRKGTNMCAILHHNDERAEFMYFSKPVVITPSYQIYVSKKGRKALNERFDRDVKKESFDTLLSRSQGLNMAITPKQSYGPDRDGIIGKYRDSIEFSYNFTEQTTLMKRLASDRIDMVLAFPWVFNYELDLLGLHSHISKIHLTDMPIHQVSNIGCAKTSVGKQIVDAIDTMSPAPHAFLKEVVVDWLTPQEVNEYRSAYSTYFEGSGKVH